MNLCERMIERRLREDIGILENHFGFISGRSSTGAIHLVWRLMKLYIYRKKACIQCSLIWRKHMIKYRGKYFEGAWRTKGVSMAYIKVIRNMYEGVRTRVRTLGGDTIDFPLDIGLHQESTISTFF